MGKGRLASREVVEAVNRRLQEKGWVVKEPAPRNGEHPTPDFQPVPAEGKPASEIIIEERG
jgi:hypothetical protein